MDCFDFAIVGSGDFNVGPAVAAGKAGGIDIGNGVAELDALDEQITEGGKNGAVDRLVVFVVGEEDSDGVAR